MTVGDALYIAATSLVEKRYPEGWGGAAALRLATGDIVTSVAPDDQLDALSLCMEVGGILDAHKCNAAVTHSLCL